MRKIITFCTLLLILWGCQKDKLPSNSNPGKYHISGKIEKGPFVKGSRIIVQELTEDLIPTGKTFNTSIKDDDGSFDLDNIELVSKYIEIITDGYFYNEVTGDLSSSPITLTGLADVSEGLSINVNILTHVTRERLIYLTKNEKLSFKDARQKAQKEFFTVFGLQNYATKNFNTFSVAAGTQESSAQLVVSATLLKNKSQAQFTEFIAELSNQFRTKGTFTDETKNNLWLASTSLDYVTIAQKLMERYTALNKKITIVDLSYFVDWNHDGVAGNELGELGQPKSLKFEMDTLKIGKNGGSFTIKIQSNILFKTEPSITAPPNLEVSLTNIFTDITVLEKTFTKDGLTISIAPSSGVLMKDIPIFIYSYDETAKDTLVIHQEGDFGKLNQDQKLGPYLSSILQQTAIASDLNFTAEAAYTNFVTLPEWSQFSGKNLTAVSSKLSDLWARNYQAIRNLNVLLNIPEIPENFKASLTSLRSIIYYQMSILWGDIIYLTNTVGIDYGEALKQTTQADLFNQLVGILSTSIGLLQIEKSNIGVPLCKDIPQHMLAKVLMNQKKFDQALPLLENVINSGRYSMEVNRDAALRSNSKELIYSLYIQNGSDYKKAYPSAEIFPIIRLSETLLLASECALQLGQNSKVINFLNKIQTGRGASPKYTASNTITLLDLQQNWKTEVYGEFSYFDFLKRNGLAESVLSIPSYKKLLPIPAQELQLSPYIRQNPGY